jgi:hypothetical protein
MPPPLPISLYPSSLAPPLPGIDGMDLPDLPLIGTDVLVSLMRADNHPVGNPKRKV